MPAPVFPSRIRLSRTRGWRLPPGAVRVDRATRWGNSWTISGARAAGFEGSDDNLAGIVVGLFANGLRWSLPAVGFSAGDVRAALAGRDLACWCRLCEAHRGGLPFNVVCVDCARCHADVLGWYANGMICEAVG